MGRTKFGMAEMTELITTSDPNAAAREWFTRLGKYCAAIDYDSAMTISADDMVAFGTRIDVVSGVNNARKEQWENIWGNIKDFKIDLDSIHSGGDERHAWAIAVWTSTGFDEKHEPYFRPGRGTVILERRDGVWLAVHSHFSLYPGTPPRTFGPKQ